MLVVGEARINVELREISNVAGRVFTAVVTSAGEEVIGRFVAKVGVPDAHAQVVALAEVGVGFKRPAAN